MKSFKQFLNEETMPYATNARGVIDIENSSVRDGLNSQLAGVTATKFVTPYIALERITKTLANYHIFIPRHSFLEGDSGMFTWPVNQFGLKIGQQNDGSFVQDGAVLKDTSKGIHPEGEDNKTIPVPNREIDKPFSIFFEYRQSDCGMFNIFCQVVSQDELDEILADIEDEMNEDEEDLKEETINEVSKRILGSYIKKAVRSATSSAYNAGRTGSVGPDADEHLNKERKRKKGIELAVKKLTKIDEVSEPKLQRYITKRSKQNDARQRKTRKSK